MHGLRLLGRVLCGALVVISLSGCAQKKPAAGTADVAALASNYERLHTGPPLTDEECRVFAESLEQTVLAGDLARMNQLVDWDAVLDRAMLGVEVQENVRKGFAQGFKSNLGSEQSLAGQIAKSAADGGTYRLLRVHREEGQPRVLFRLVGADSNGINYHDYIVARRANNQIRIVDIYIMLTGEEFSQTLRRLFVPVAANESRGLVDRLTKNESELVKNLPRIQQMSMHVQEGRHREAMQIYHQLPEELRKDKNVLTVRLVAAQALGEREYTSALEDLRANFGDGPAVDLLSIDSYLLKQRYADALASIDRLDKKLGGDPYLNVYRANVHASAGDLAAARLYADKAIELEPDAIDGHWTAVTISLRQRDFDRTLSLLSTISDKFALEFVDMTTLPEYAEFVESPQYQKWLEKHPVK